MSRYFDAADVISNVIVVLIILAAVLFARLLWKSPVWGEGLRRLSRNRLAMICLAVLLGYCAVGLTDSVRWRSDPHVQSASALDYLFRSIPEERTYSAPLAHHEIGERRLRPLHDWRHILGTDGLGNDVFYKVLKGVRTALIVGGFTLLLSVPLAIVFGISAGYFGGFVDDAIQYLYITLSSIPDILLLVTLMMVLGKGVFQICIALAVTQWVGLGRYLRGETLKHREKEYVLAARAMGVHPVRILARHIFPNVFHLVIITSVLSFSGLVLSETILSYLGIGVPSNVGSWGLMIDSSRMELARDPVVWWNLLGAAGALFILVLCVNLVGDGLRDALDPRLKNG
jgi:peptide/nickel transport system permease protein